MGAISGFFSWMLQKLAYALLLAVLGVAGVALWLFLQDRTDFALQQRETVRTLTGETVGLRTALAGAVARMAVMRTELAAQQERAKQAAKVAIDLEALSSGFNRLTTSSEQLRENEEGRERMRQMVADSAKRAGEIEQGLVRTQWEKDGLEIALERKQKQLAAATSAGSSRVVHYVREAWATGGKWVLGAVALVMLGPVFFRRRRKR